MCSKRVQRGGGAREGTKLPEGVQLQSHFLWHPRISVCIGHKVRIYKEYHSVMSPRRNWDSPNPSLASDCAPPSRTGGGDTLACGWGVEGSPNSDDGLEKKLSFSTLPILYAVGLFRPLQKVNVCPSFLSQDNFCFGTLSEVFFVFWNCALLSLFLFVSFFSSFESQISSH